MRWLLAVLSDGCLCPLAGDDTAFKSCSQYFFGKYTAKETFLQLRHNQENMTSIALQY